MAPLAWDKGGGETQPKILPSRADNSITNERDNLTLSTLLRISETLRHEIRHPSSPAIVLM